MTLPGPTLKTSLCILALTIMIMLFWRGFNDPDEGRYSEIPREMVTSGNWLEMRMLGYRYYEKPPLSYWLVAPAISIFGAKDWAVRIPLGINLLLIAAVFYGVTRRFWPRNTTILASFVMLSSVGFLAGLGLLLTDAFLVLWFALTCFCLFLGFRPDAPPARRWLWILAAGAFAALGFLTKGAIAIVLPGAITVLWLIWEKRWKALWTLSLPGGLLVFLAIVAPVLVLIEHYNPGFFKQFVIEEHFARFTGTRRMQAHPEPFWFFIPITPLLLLPWSLFLVRAVRTVFKNPTLRRDTLSRFYLVWAGVVLVFFSISTGKLMSYILPAIPPLLLLLGRWGIAEPQDGTVTDRRLWRLGAWGLFLLLAGLAGAWLIAYFQVIPSKVYPITGISLLAFIPAAAALIFWWRQRTLFSMSSLASIAATLLLAVAVLLSPLAGKDFNVLLHINSSHVYKRLAAELKPGDQIIVFWGYRPALMFYTGHLYTPFQDHNELLYGMEIEPNRPHDLETTDEVRQRVAACPGRLFALVEPKDWHKKFIPLGLRYEETQLPRDPDTIILRLK